MVKRLAISMTMLFILSLTGCFAPVPVADLQSPDVMGRWQSDNEGSMVIIEFNDNGAFEATGWPVEIMCNDYRWLKVSELTGVILSHLGEAGELPVIGFT